MPLPRARLDPIVDESTALTVLLTAATVPVRHETVLALLDHDHCGVALVVVNGTEDPDSVVTVVDRVLHTDAIGDAIGATAIATIRPGHHCDGSSGIALDDADRWLEIDAIASECGIRLLDWFVVSDTVSRPRCLVNEPPRWGSRPPRS